MATHHDKPETEEQPTVKKLRIDEDAASVESATTPEDKAESIEVSAGESSAEEKDPEVEAITGSSRSGLTPQAMGGTTPKAVATPAPTPTPTGSSTPASSGFGGFSSYASGGFAAFAKPAASTDTASSTSSGFAAFAKPASDASSSSSGFGSSLGFSGFAMKTDASAGFGAFAKSADDTADGFGEAATADFDPNAEDASVEFTPVVTLTEAEIANGEEEERIIVEKRAKLFKLVGTDYVEVGIGPFRVLKPKDAHDIDQARASARMVMRRESHPHGPGTKLILNARLTVCVSCVKKSEKSLMVVVVEAPGSNESENDQPTDAAKTLKPVTYLLRFASSDDLLLVQDRVVDLLPAHASTS